MMQSPTEIAENIADMGQWAGFNGYGMLPGIDRAEYEQYTPEMVGSHIRVYNSDGSTHIEEVLVWALPHELKMKLHQFSAPVNRIATHFIEHWTFWEVEDGTHVTRSFQLFPQSTFTRPILWLISRQFKKAIDAHLDQIAHT